MQRTTASDLDSAVGGGESPLDALDSLDRAGLDDGCQHRDQRIVGALYVGIPPLVLRHGTSLGHESLSCRPGARWTLKPQRGNWLIERLVRPNMRLVLPSTQWRSAFLEMARECAAAGEQRYALALRDFDAYVQKAEANRRGHDLPEGWMPSIELWLELDGRIVACARLRRTLTAELEHEGGHVGYDVRPSMRRLGHGTALLRLALAEARALGIERVRVTCDEENIGSIKVIERNGGVLAGVGISRKTGKPVRQYWIER